MKIISIVSSGRKNGNTERMVKRIEDDFLQLAAEKNLKAEFEQIRLADSDIRLCRGCRLCFDKGEKFCPLKDSLLDIRDKLDQADGVILASPVYVEDVNGIMKNWIDRMAFNCHRPAFAGKAAVAVATSGAGSSGHVLKTMKFALISWGFNVSAQIKFRTGGFIDDGQMSSRYGKQIKAAAGKFFNAVNRAKYPSFYSLMAFKMQQKFWGKTERVQNTFDYSYWKNKGWLEKNCSYYTHHDSSPIKVKLAGIAGNIVSIFLI